MAPPNDDDHGCAFRDYAKHLEAKLASVQADLEVLKRAFAHRSEKRGKKMPPVVGPPRTPEDSAERRGARALLRAERMETKEEGVAVPAEMKQCSACADPRFRKVGNGKTCETYSYVPGYFRRTVHRLETLGCRCGATIVTAPAPKRWAENTRYDASFVAYLITTKCLASMPHYRLEQQLTRTGIPVARSTINELFRRAAQKLSRLRPLLLEAIRNDVVVYVDETTFKLTTKASKAYIWTFVGQKLTAYRFDLTRSGAVPIDVLGDSCGAIVCDDYRGYDPLTRRCKRTRCGCLAHARRKYFEAGGVPEAREALDLIGAIYAVEHEAERRGIVGTEAHLALRRAYARPYFVRLLQLARELRRLHGPKTLLGRAAAYTWRNMLELGRFLRDARIRPDNNYAEGALRIVALGRKNFLFVHSEDAGNELALLYSLAVSCTRAEHNPIEYLADVLNRIDTTNDDALRDLLPDRWQPPPKLTAEQRFDADA